VSGSMTAGVLTSRFLKDQSYGVSAGELAEATRD